MITYELAQLPELRRKFDPKLIDKALERALQVAAMKTRTRVSKEVRKVYNVKAGAISKAVRLSRIPGGRLLLYAGRVIPLDKFGARKKVIRTGRGRRTGVTVQVRKDHRRQIVKHAFMADVHGQKVFKREGQSRLPIRRVFGPSIAHMVGNEFVTNLAIRQTGEDAAIEFNRYLEYLMSRA